MANVSTGPARKPAGHHLSGNHFTRGIYADNDTPPFGARPSVTTTAPAKFAVNDYIEPP